VSKIYIVVVTIVNTQRFLLNFLQFALCLTVDQVRADLVCYRIACVEGEKEVRAWMQHARNGGCKGAGEAKVQP
jgi:hypothetical protein